MIMKMKKGLFVATRPFSPKILISCLCGLMFMGLISSAFAVERRGDQGIGVVIGSPSGLTWKMWLDEQVGVDAALGVTDNDLDFHTTLLWHNFSWINNMNDSEFFSDIRARGELPIYVGIGPRILFEDKSEFGLRIPLGISFLPKDNDWDVFLEFAPVLRLTPSTGVNGTIGLGARYYFPAIRPRAQ